MTAFDELRAQAQTLASPILVWTLMIMTEEWRAGVEHSHQNLLTEAAAIRTLEERGEVYRH